MKLKKFYFKKIKSTNDIALTFLRKGIDRGAILTDFQTNGRGQRGKKLISQLKIGWFIMLGFIIKIVTKLKIF